MLRPWMMIFTVLASALALARTSSWPRPLDEQVAGSARSCRVDVPADRNEQRAGAAGRSSCCARWPATAGIDVQLHAREDAIIVG